MGMRPERAAIRIFCCHGSCVVGLRMWFVGADVICRRGCDLSGCGCGLSARMLAIPAAVGSAIVRKDHSGGRRQYRLYARIIPAAVGSTAVHKEHSGGCRQCGCTQGCLPLNCNILAI